MSVSRKKKQKKNNARLKLFELIFIATYALAKLSKKLKFYIKISIAKKKYIAPDFTKRELIAEKIISYEEQRTKCNHESHISLNFNTSPI